MCCVLCVACCVLCAVCCVLCDVHQVVGTGSEDASSMLFDLRAHGPLNKFSKDSAMLGVFSVCFSKSGRLLFAGNGENVCNAWDTLATDG